MLAFNRQYPGSQVLERLEEQGWDEDQIVVSVELMKSWFDAVVDDIIRAVRESLARVTVTGCTVDYMLIVGGFGASPYLIAKLREAFSDHVREVVCPGVPSQAVLKGKSPPPLLRLQLGAVTDCCLTRPNQAATPGLLLGTEAPSAHENWQQ